MFFLKMNWKEVFTKINTTNWTPDIGVTPNNVFKVGWFIVNKNFNITRPYCRFTRPFKRHICLIKDNRI